MFEYTVKMLKQCTALLQLEPRGVWMLASACGTVPTLILLSEYYQVCSRDSEDSGSVRSGLGVWK